MIIQRSDRNPILKPNRKQSWEAETVFNGCPIKKGKKTHLVYRAMSLPHYHSSTGMEISVSDIGIAESDEGINFTNRRRFIVPEHEWEKFGCEDPRITKLGNKYYIFYTALSTFPFTPEGIKVGVAISKDLDSIQEKHLVTPFNAKGMALFPEKIGGKFWSVLTVNTDRPPSKICLANFNKEKEMWSEKKWNQWYKNVEKYSLPLQRREEDHIEVGAPPIKTKAGWLLIYSYIQNYFSNNRLLGIEAVLLDLKNPMKVIAKTKAPILFPEEYYEKVGYVPDVIFPSGAIIEENWIHLYYGATDTTCCLAYIEINSLLDYMLNRRAVKFVRPKKNPIIVPNKKNSWESKATFNPAAIYLDGKVHIIYRAMSEDNTSVFGYAQSKDGIKIDYKSGKPIYIPREPFEQKKQPGGNSGCEDPRLTKMGNKIYMYYTSFDGKNPPRIALTSILEKDFLNQKWNWSKPILISAPNFDNKDACLFPEKINEKYMIIHRSGNDIDLAFYSSLDKKENWLEEYRWISPRRGWWDGKKVGAAAPPIKTKEGWILFYHGVSNEGIYRVGAILLDLDNPKKIIARTDEPLFEPEMPYEKEGQIPNVVFPCGAVLIDKKIFMYYGGGDSVVGVATINLKDLLKRLITCKC